jgi:hypothetical protein
MYIGLHVIYPLFLSDFKETWIFSTYLLKIIKYQISWKSVCWKTSCSMWTARWTDGRTDRQTGIGAGGRAGGREDRETWLGNSRFRSFSISPRSDYWKRNGRSAARITLLLLVSKLTADKTSSPCVLRSVVTRCIKPLRMDILCYATVFWLTVNQLIYS